MSKNVFSYDDGVDIAVECDIENVCNEKHCYSVYSFIDGNKFVLEKQRKELFEYVRGNYK